jgi:hypothetical protein
MAPRTESIQEAVAAARSRWRAIAIGLALVGLTNLVNTYLVVGHRTAEAIPVVCVATVYNPALAEYAIEQSRDGKGGRFNRP